MCRRECLAGEQCEHEAICHAPDLSMLTAILANAGGKVHIRGGWQLNDITADLTRTYGRPFKGYMDKAWWRVGSVTVMVSESGDDRLCTCECPECGATAKFDVELELDRYPGSGYGDIDVDCPRCDATITIESQVRMIGAAIKF